MNPEKITVIGGGTWGTALADLLGKGGHQVTVWEFFEKAANELKTTRTLPVMPQLRLHESVQVTSNLEEALKDTTILLSAIPSEFVRRTFEAIAKTGLFTEKNWIISVTKGIENNTLKRMSEVIEETLPAAKDRIVVLSGPSHAEEVAQGVPTAVVAAGPEDLARRTQEIVNHETFRVYTSPDLTGVELGGALKNIYALACGACDGLGLGDNSKAALMTRALNEMVQIGLALGAEGITFFGLSGVGDLIVTCGSKHSRNRLLGEKIGQGKSLKEALGEMTMVAEGVRTTESVHHLAQKLKLDLPIVEELYQCIHQGKPAQQSLQDLLTRPVTDEMIHVEHILNRQKGAQQ